MAEKKADASTKDDELDELLDSKYFSLIGQARQLHHKIYFFTDALLDFDKVANKDSKDASNKDEVEDPPMETLWNEEFIAQQAKMFEKQMTEIFGSTDKDKEVTPEQISLGFQRIAEAASMAINTEGASQMPQVDPAFQQSISDMLKGLGEGQENLQHGFSSDDLGSMFGNINLSESGDQNAFLPFMQGMMQSLL